MTLTSTATRAAHAVDAQSVHLAVRAEPRQGRCNALARREGRDDRQLQLLLVGHTVGRPVAVSAELTRAKSASERFCSSARWTAACALRRAARRALWPRKAACSLVTTTTRTAT